MSILAIVTASDFYAKTQEDVRQLNEQIDDSARAMNAILSTYHLHEWVSRACPVLTLQRPRRNSSTSPSCACACGFANAKATGYEADDFLAAAVAKAERRGVVLVATGDRDAYQLASAKTTILQPIKAGEMARIGPAEVRERYGVDPTQVPDFIALRGDASDRIPGAKGVGPKTAAGLLVKYGSLEKLLAAGRFAAQADDLRLYRSIATMDRAAPLPSLKSQMPTWAKASALARQWELNRLAERLAGLAQAKA